MLRSLSIFLLFLNYTAVCQSGLPNQMAYQHQLQSQSTYAIVKAGEAIDTLLTYQEWFSPLGYSVKQTVFNDQGEAGTSFHYYYTNDSILARRDTYFGDSLAIVTHTTRQGNKRISADYNTKGGATGTYSVTTYNKGGERVSEQVFINKVLVVHKVFSYYSNGQLKSRKVRVGPQSTVTYNRDGEVIKGQEIAGQIEKTSITTDDGLVITTEIYRNNQSLTILGLAGPITLQSGDIRRIATTTTKEGLVLAAKEWVNDELKSAVIYRYE